MSQENLSYKIFENVAKKRNISVEEVKKNLKKNLLNLQCTK